jgi:DNA transformation protein
MRSSGAFRDFALDQLAGVPGVSARAMFGGIGLYAGDVFFGIIASDVLYLKVDDSNRPGYVAAGSRAFRPFADRAMVMPYYEVPVGVLESPDTLAAWARASIRIASAKASNRSKAARMTGTAAPLRAKATSTTGSKATPKTSKR